MGRRPKNSQPAEHAEAGDSAEVLWALGEQQKLLDPLKQFAAEFAYQNDDNPQALAFKQEVRKAASALADARHAFRQALGLTALEARQGAERELAAHGKALRPDVG